MCTVDGCPRVAQHGGLCRPHYADERPIDVRSLEIVAQAVHTAMALRTVIFHLDFLTERARRGTIGHEEVIHHLFMLREEAGEGWRALPGEVPGFDPEAYHAMRVRPGFPPRPD